MIDPAPTIELHEEDRHRLAAALLEVNAHRVATNLAFYRSAVVAAETQQQRDLSEWERHKRALSRARSRFADILVEIADGRGVNVFQLEHSAPAYARTMQWEFPVRADDGSFSRLHLAWHEESEYEVTDSDVADFPVGSRVYVLPDPRTGSLFVAGHTRVSTSEAGSGT